MAPQVLTEDDIYRSSTQYKLWSFTPEAIRSIRSSNNTAATEQALAQLQSTSDESLTNTDTDTTQPTNLTPAEELTLLSSSTRHLIRTGLTKLNLPTPVVATGAVYLRRFYLSHSPLTHPPATIMPTCLFLATKTEHYYVPLSKFTDDWTPAITPAAIIAEEGTVSQALRFCFEVHHPFRGLRGILLELRALAAGTGAPTPASQTTPADAQAEMLRLRAHSDAAAPTDDGKQAAVSPKEAQARAFKAHDRAKQILASAGLLTDAYFLYTPAQLLFAALTLADEPLARFYLSTKLPRPPPPSLGDASVENGAADEARVKAQAFNDRLHSTIASCAELLSEALGGDAEEDEEGVGPVERKLAEYRKRLGWDGDGVGLGSKRNGEEGEDGEKAAKKRKLLNGRSDSPFGGPLRREGEGVKKGVDS